MIAFNCGNPGQLQLFRIGAHPHSPQLIIFCFQVVKVTGEVGEGWWKGRIGREVGMFPSDYVEIIPDDLEILIPSTKSHPSQDPQDMPPHCPPDHEEVKAIHGKQT